MTCVDLADGSGADHESSEGFHYEPDSDALTCRTAPSWLDHTEHAVSKPTSGFRYEKHRCSKSARLAAESAISETDPESRSAENIAISFTENISFEEHRHAC
jgi:hypothetical protein